jgi:hypothetical protein
MKNILILILFTTIISITLYAQKSKSYTEAYLKEFQKTNDIFLAEESGRRADKKDPKNELVDVYNKKKFKGLKEINFGSNKAKCTDNAQFNSIVHSDVNSRLFALCALKVKDSYLLYQGYTTKKSKRIEFTTNSVLIPSISINWWLGHFNLSETSKNYLLNQ